MKKYKKKTALPQSLHTEPHRARATVLQEHEQRATSYAQHTTTWTNPDAADTDPYPPRRGMRSGPTARDPDPEKQEQGVRRRRQRLRGDRGSVSCMCCACLLHRWRSSHFSLHSVLCSDLRSQQQSATLGASERSWKKPRGPMRSFAAAALEAHSGANLATHL